MSLQQVGLSNQSLSSPLSCCMGTSQSHLSGDVEYYSFELEVDANSNSLDQNMWDTN